MDLTEEEEDQLDFVFNIFYDDKYYDEFDNPNIRPTDKNVKFLMDIYFDE